MLKKKVSQDSILIKKNNIKLFSFKVPKRYQLECRRLPVHNKPFNAYKIRRLNASRNVQWTPRNNPGREWPLFCGPRRKILPLHLKLYSKQWLTPWLGHSGSPQRGGILLHGHPHRETRIQCAEGDLLINIISKNKMKCVVSP